MKKVLQYIFLVISTISICLNSEGQTVEWKHSIGLMYSEVKALGTDSTGNVYTAGHYMWDEVNEYYTGLFLRKYDPQGNIIWADTAKATMYATPMDGIVDKAGNMYLTGWFVGTLRFGNTPVTFAGTSFNHNYFLAKYNSSGACEWVRYGYSSQARGICLDPDGNIYVNITIWDTLTIDNHFCTAGGVVAKFSPSGNCLWTLQCHGSIDFGDVTYLNGSIHTGGSANYTAATIGNVYLYQTGSHTGFFATLDTAGNLISAIHSNPQYGYRLQGENGSLYLKGNPGCLNFGDTVLCSTYDEWMVAKQDSNWNYLWGRMLGGYVGGMGFAVDENGNTYNCYRPGNVGNMNLNMVKFDKDGNKIWDTFLFPGWGGASHIHKDENSGAIYVTGGYMSSYIAKVDESTVSVGAIQEEDNFLSVYPNPSESAFTVWYSGKKGNIALRICNMLGQCVYAETYDNISGEMMKTIDLGEQGKGVYFLEVMNGKERSVKKLVVQ